MTAITSEKNRSGIFRKVTSCLPFCFLVITGCTTSGKLVSPAPESEIKYSIIYIIHADANYLYHEKEGTAKRADEKVLEEARMIGEQASNGEVFIFRQLPERKILWFFRKKSREFILYRNGKHVGKQHYHPETEHIFAAESAYYRTSRVNRGSVDTPVFFLYFGHEIPARGGFNYHHTFPGVPVNIQTFASGLNHFLPDSSARFALTALSTCNNGTPDMAGLLADKTDYLLASPQNLHLSHFDTRALTMLESNSKPATDKLAGMIAENTYQRLSESVFTEITLSLYDLSQVTPYISKLSEIHNSQTESVYRYSLDDNTDCASRDFFQKNDYTAGVKSWYQPPRFGPHADRKSHSGWGCRPGN